MTAATYRDDWVNHNSWTTTSQAVVLCTSVKNQVIEFIGYIGTSLKIISRIDRNLIEQRINSVTVAAYTHNHHRVKPFFVVIECQSNNEYWAKFEEAGIVVSGKSVKKAIGTLREYVVELYDIFKDATSLGPEPQHQLSVLEKYIV